MVAIPEARRRATEHRLCVAKLILATTSLGSAIPAYAADNPPSAASTDQFNEIIITATRQNTTVQTTPFSITAISANQIAARGIVDVDSLVNSVPAISIRNTGGPGEMEFEVRGLNSQGGNSSMVGLYFGEIPLSTALGSQLGHTSADPGLYDMKRAEVLTGPQGTLYGSSSMGGTIRLIPASAQLGTYSASTQVIVSGTASGSGLNHQENGMINIPLGDKAALRIVGSLIDDTGWIKRLVLTDGSVAVDSGAFPDVSRPANFYSAPAQESLNGANSTKIDSIRATILWQPLPNLTIEPLVMHQQIEQAAPPAIDVNGSPAYPTLPQTWAHYEIYDTPEPQTDTMTFGSLNVVYQLPLFSVTSATGYWRRKSTDLQDVVEQAASAVGIPVYDATQGGIGPITSTLGPGILEQDTSRQVSEELRLASTGSGPIKWVAGYFYQNLRSATTISALAEQGTPIFGGTALSVNYIVQDLVQNAVYGNLSWRYSSHFEAAVGLRHYVFSLNETSVENGVFTPLGPEGTDVVFNDANTTRASGTVPSFSLTYNFDRNRMIYARAGKGFRLGGVSAEGGPIPVAPASNTNPNFASLVANECGLQAKVLLTTVCNPNIFLSAPRTFSPDTLWSYEVGEKSSFFDRRLTINLSAYLENWSNPQVATNVSGFGLTVNGGNAQIKGIEGQIQARLPAGFNLSANGSFVDAKFRASSALTGFPAGTQIPDTPRVSGSAILQWEHALANGLVLSSSLEDTLSGPKTDLPYGVTATLLNINQLLVHLPGYSIANFRFGIAGEHKGNGRWTAALFVNNLANKHVLLDPQPQIGLQTGAFERFVMNQPLTAGVDVSFTF